MICRFAANYKVRRAPDFLTVTDSGGCQRSRPTGRDSLSMSSHGPLGLDLEIRATVSQAFWAVGSGPVGVLGNRPAKIRDGLLLDEVVLYNVAS
jgi:hypothetical protein